MAKKKKKENTLSYLQMPLPEGAKYSKMTKVSFGGLNKRYTLDSGELTMEKNISTNEYPYLTPSETRDSLDDLKKYYITEQTGNVMERYPITMAAFDNFIVVVYYEYTLIGTTHNHAIKVDYIADDGEVHTGIVKDYGEDENSEIRDTIFEPRSILQFNVYDTPTDPVAGEYVKKLLFFPDKASMFMRFKEMTSDYDINTAETDVMYWYEEDKVKKYFFIKVNRETDKNGKVTYKRAEKSSGTANCFECDGMTAEIKDYYNDTPEIDASGAIIYPPPETASHNCYYRNTYNHIDTGNGTDIYKWCEYDALKREDEWGLQKDDKGKLLKDENGDYIPVGFVKDSGGNYVPDGTTYGWKVSLPPVVPDIKYATVHLSRVFGVDDDRVYASGYNNYANWNLDTIDEYNESNAWCSPSQSNTKADGHFTGITTFQNHVICFKRDFMHEIYNTKNPFRIQDIYAEGTIDHRTIQDVDGKLIFVSEDDVKIYTGSNPRIIGYKLNMPRYKYAVSGTDNRNYYLYCESDAEGINKHLYVYDTFTELWSEQSIDSRVISFAHNKNGMYMLCDDGYVYEMDTGDYNHEWSFETDLITNRTVDIKHIKKLQMLVDVGKPTREADMRVYILYDDEVFETMLEDEKARHLVYSNNNKQGKLPIRVKPRKTANYGFKLHIEGTGYVKLYELEIFVEQGGAMYV